METATNLTSVITSDLLGSVLNQLVAVLPVTIGAAVSFIGLRKALGFVLSTIRNA